MDKLENEQTNMTNTRSTTEQRMDKLENEQTDMRKILTMITARLMEMAKPGQTPGAAFNITPKDMNKIMPEKNVKTFRDVKGCDDAKQELEEVVQYLKYPSKFTRLGGKLPKGILLTGSPGTGKTLLAKAVAGETGVPFFYRAGSEFEEVLVGVGAKRVRSLFEAAKQKAPCIIFIDEIDAVGSTRMRWEGRTNETLHQLLVEMDGFEQNEGIIVMAATNWPDILDQALTRPGRFDRHIVVPKPDVRGREEILELYLQDKPLADDVNVNSIARRTPGFNGADLANLVNIAAIKAAVEGAEKLNASQLEFAKDRIIMGTERKTMFLSEDSKKLIAYHESGHAIVALNTEGAHPIDKATIMPRGSALGMVCQLPSNDETSITKKQLLARIDVCMGGRVAEELIFGPDHITTGASSDLSSAAELAGYMVSACGMSDEIGPVHMRVKPGSELESRVDAEVVKLLKDAYNRAKALLKMHEKALHALANALLEYETLNSVEIKRILLPYNEGRLFENIEQQQQEVAEEVELVEQQQQVAEEEEHQHEVAEEVEQQQQVADKVEQQQQVAEKVEQQQQVAEEVELVEQQQQVAEEVEQQQQVAEEVEQQQQVAEEEEQQQQVAEEVELIVGVNTKRKKRKKRKSNLQPTSPFQLASQVGDWNIGHWEKFWAVANWLINIALHLLINCTNHQRAKRNRKRNSIW